MPGAVDVAKPWTMGWQPDYPGEAKLYAKYILTHKPSAKIGVLYQDDAYGKNYLTGLKTGPRLAQEPDRRRRVVQRRRLGASAIGAHVVAHRDARRRHVRDLRDADAVDPALVHGRRSSGWTPLTFLNNVSANRVFMLAAESTGRTPTA